MKKRNGKTMKSLMELVYYL